MNSESEKVAPAGIVDRSLEYAIRVVELYRQLEQTGIGRILGKQLLRSGTSIGANIQEAQGAQSKADFISKISVSSILLTSKKNLARSRSNSSLFTLHSSLNKRGFTFVEILITLVVIAVAVTPLLQMYATATEQIAYTDDLRTGLDLAREEVEKLKNLALTEDQIKRLGNLISSPIVLNKAVWYTVRMVNQTASPLEVQVLVYRNQLWGPPVTSLVTIINK